VKACITAAGSHVLAFPDRIEFLNRSHLVPEAAPLPYRRIPRQQFFSASTLSTATQSQLKALTSIGMTALGRLTQNRLSR
jgi:hypothetical protein